MLMYQECPEKYIIEICTIYSVDENTKRGQYLLFSVKAH